MKDKLKKQLTAINEHITELINERTKFLDDNMHHFAEFQIGEEVYNCNRHTFTIVKDHYRYFTNRDPLYDTGLHCDCRFNNGDNTSCYGFLHPFVSKKDFDNETNVYIKKLKSLARN